MILSDQIWAHFVPDSHLARHYENRVKNAKNSEKSLFFQTMMDSIRKSTFRKNLFFGVKIVKNTQKNSDFYLKNRVQKKRSKKCPDPVRNTLIIGLLGTPKIGYFLGIFCLFLGFFCYFWVRKQIFRFLGKIGNFGRNRQNRRFSAPDQILGLGREI